MQSHAFFLLTSPMTSTPQEALNKPQSAFFCGSDIALTISHQ
ncbi:hypothetical protein HC081234_16510 [Helicobacter cinaedi]|nr:hypothetical protein HC081234_16510 [Helicobacter cinaedi]